MGEPRISVAMSVYNNERFVAEAIESILAQTEPDFELLIVNDGSNDGSEGIIDRFAAQDARIRAFHQPNQGLITSLNFLLAEARASFVARMDGDDVALPERFALQAAFLEAHPEISVVGTNTHELDENGRISACTDFHPADPETFRAMVEEKPPLCHPSVMMRRADVIAAGGYRPAYRHCEDYDLWLRLSERTGLCSLPERLMLYRRSDSQVSTRHAIAQQTGAAIARLAHRERQEGRPDPTAGLTAPPAIAELDALFGRTGVSREVRGRVAVGLRYSHEALRGEGFTMLLDHLRDGGARDGLWRTVVRLLRFREPRRAARLAAALAMTSD